MWPNRWFVSSIFVVVPPITIAWPAVLHIMLKMHGTQPLQQEPLDSVSSMKLNFHIAQRMLRLVGTMALRAVVKHPLGWPLSQVSAWRSFFGAVGDLQSWVPVVKEQVQTGTCSSWWIRLRPEDQPQNPKTHINWVFLHGGAFVAGDALMYLGTYAYWLHRLAKAGISCSILSVDYPLAPEHPFPAAVEAAAGVIEWLTNDSGETAPYIVGGDSAGGNLTVAALAMLRDQGRLKTLPLALTLISPALDMSDASAFGRRETVSSHIDIDQAAAASEVAAAPAESPAGIGLQQPHLGNQSQAPDQKKQHTVGGITNPWQLLKSLYGEMYDGWRVHTSKEGAQAAAARGWFDYLPGPSIADDLHHYLHDPALLSNPLISPTYLKDFTGLSQLGMLLVAGGAELMRPDIAAFAKKAAAAGVDVQYHEEPNECHCYAMLALPHLLRKGHTVLEYVTQVATAGQNEQEN